MKLQRWQAEHWTEADVVVELCHQLKLRKFQVRCEVRVESQFHRSGAMRCDVAIVDGDEILCLFEVKDKPPFEINPQSRQRLAYEAANEHVPVYFVYGMDRVAMIVVCATEWLLEHRRRHG